MERTSTRKTGGRRIRAALFMSALVTAMPGAALAAKPGTPTAKPKAPAKPRELTFERFGKVAVLYPKGEPKQVVIFFSGDGGWAAGVVDMARYLVSEGALVLGVTTPRYILSTRTGLTCVDTGKDTVALRDFAQKQLKWPESLLPVVVGYSSGATLVYAALAQAPEGSFQGGMSLGFCPDLEMSTPFCEGGAGLTRTRTPDGKSELLSAVKTVPAPWYVLEGNIDETCPLPNVETFSKEMGNVHVVPLDKVGHGFSKPRHWLKEYQESFRTLTAPASAPALETDGGTAPAMDGGLPVPPMQDGGAMPAPDAGGAPDAGTSPDGGLRG